MSEVFTVGILNVFLGRVGTLKTASAERMPEEADAVMHTEYLLASLGATISRLQDSVASDIIVAPASLLPSALVDWMAVAGDFLFFFFPQRSFCNNLSSLHRSHPTLASAGDATVCDPKIARICLL